MNELNNVANVNGTYDNIPTSLTSNTSVVNLIEGLTLTKDADKKNWSSGDLTYTITIDNQTDKSYVGPVLTDVIDNNFVDFIEDSVMLDGVKMDTSKYSYDTGTHTLTVNLDDISASSSTTLTFRVKKKA